MEILQIIVNTIVVPCLGYIVFLRFKKMIDKQMDEQSKKKK